MSDDSRPATPEEVAQAEAYETHRTLLAIDQLHATAVGVARLIERGAEEAPRLLVAAACRTLERMMERYDRAKAELAAGAPPNPAFMVRLEREISAGANDLYDVLQEGHKALDTIRAVIGTYGPPQ